MRTQRKGYSNGIGDLSEPVCRFWSSNKEMPNSGMLDHRAYKPRPESRRLPRVSWLGAWPSQAGYQTDRTVRVTAFSRHLMLEAQKQMHLQRSIQSRPNSSRVILNNSISPFHTREKPTCGYFFTRETDHRRIRFGVEPSNLVTWRTNGRDPNERKRMIKTA